MARRQFVFDEPAAKVTVTIDTRMIPKKNVPSGVAWSTPIADRLAKIVGGYIEHECGEQKAAA